VTDTCAVLDIGKTNVKLHVVDRCLNTLFRRDRANGVVGDGPYPHVDVNGIWCWLLDTLREAGHVNHVDAIVVTTHGATVALVHPDAGESGLVLPVMDYEFEGVASESDYDAIRPPFAETLSPALPAGLNLGRQLFWQQRHCEPAFDKVRYILPYPQYWAWRLSGAAVSEVSSWGCHSDLWSPVARDYSALVDHLGLRRCLPPLARADWVLGTVRPDVARQAGLPADCSVVAGIHDSNASYLRHLARRNGGPFTVVSTGTWVVSFSASTDLARLDPRRDMLANVDIDGRPVACARFMGGREFEVVCRHAGADPAAPVTLDAVQGVIDQQIFALPDFSDGSGPFGGRRPEIRGRAGNGAALASLYCALLLDYELDLLGSEGELLVEGAWLKNPVLCAALAQLRPRQDVYLSNDETGTVSGAAQLVFGNDMPEPELQAVTPAALRGLDEYRHLWRDMLCVS